MPVIIFLFAVFANAIIVKDIISRFGPDIGVGVGAALFFLSAITCILMKISDTLDDIRDKK